jgi:predicted transcriptional regulator
MPSDRAVVFVRMPDDIRRALDHAAMCSGVSRSAIVADVLSCVVDELERIAQRVAVEQGRRVSPVKAVA